MKSIRIFYYFVVFFFLFIITGCKEHARENSVSIEQNKEVVKTLLIDVLQNGKLELYKDLHIPEFTGHALERDFNLEEDYQSAGNLIKNFRNLKMDITHLMAEADLVTARYVGSWGDSVSRAKADGITIFRFKDGKIAEEWVLTNELAIMNQMKK